VARCLSCKLYVKVYYGLFSYTRLIRFKLDRHLLVIIILGAATVMGSNLTNTIGDVRKSIQL